MSPLPLNLLCQITERFALLFDEALCPLLLAPLARLVVFYLAKALQGVLGSVLSQYQAMGHIALGVRPLI